jgi:dynein heavy chain
MQQEFFAILGNDLKAVTGSSDQINNFIDRVKEQVRKLETFSYDVFNPEYMGEWKQTFTNFGSQIDALETETTNLIGNTFKEKLTSSDGAFELLSKFKNVETRPKIQEELSNKYKNVLEQYLKELNNMEELFNANKERPPIPKNMPTNSGSIAWARSIITRIKTPIDKFKSKHDILTRYDEGMKSAQTYVRIAKQLTEVHEKDIFDKWKQANTSEAIKFLKDPILTKEGNGEN